MSILHTYLRPPNANLEQAHLTRCSLAVPHVTLRRPDHKRARTCRCAVHCAERTRLGRIAQSRAGAVRLGAADLRSLERRTT